MPTEQTLIYDVGAHIGQDSDFYLRKGFKVVAVEACPDLSCRLRERFRSYEADGRLVLIDAAIAEQEGEVEFYFNESKSEWGTIRPDWAARNLRLGAPSRKIKVRAIPFGSVLRRYGIPYYLKVDIEGADLLCLEALAGFSEKPNFVSLESDKRSWEGLLREFEMLQGLGYNRFKVIDQGNIMSQAPPEPSREGAYVKHSFEFGASGLFGEELPGSWLTADAALDKYRTIFSKYRMFGDYGRWRDNLAVRLGRHLPGVSRIFQASWYDTHATRA